jgi:(R)-2-hydroxyacyl-CoA dehydratese activating ATPase
MDLGSRVVKIIDFRDDTVKSMIGYDTVEFYRSFGKMEGRELAVAFEKLGLAPELAKLTVTGYGRNTVRVKGARVISEVKAHTIGAVHQSGLTDFTLLDIGGQDTKVISVAGARMVDFTMNDKCAASSGRYVENMARILGLSLGDVSEHVRNPAELSATCAIFGESEIIQKITEGVPTSEIAAGVNLTIVKRVLPMLARFPNGPIVFSGGVAKNKAVAFMLMAATGRKVIPLSEPTFNGAIGCALYSINA